jgi:hypothetical protein
MVQELVFNVALLLFFIYCYFYIGATAPEPIPGQLDGAEWPRLLIVLLVIFICANIYKIIKNRLEGKEESTKINLDLKGIVTSKLFIGSVFLLVYAYTLDYVGFLFGTIVFFMAYAWLLGERQISRLVLSSVFITIVLYIIFAVGLDVFLPRGKGVFREIAFMIESIF